MRKNEIHIYRDIPGYPGYQASNLGRIRNKKGHVMTPQYNKNGYTVIGMHTNGTYVIRRVHRLVALAWVPGYKEGLEIDHINHIRDDNRAVNLRWVTHAENMAHSKHRMHVPHKGTEGSTGIKYVTLLPHGKYRVRIKSCGIVASMTCETLEEAVACRNKILRQHKMEIIREAA